MVPPVASAILVELREHPDGDMRVRFMYRNDTVSSGSQSPPHLLIPRVCRDGDSALDEEGCRLSMLEANLKGTASIDLVNDCKLPQIDSSFSCLDSSLGTCPVQQRPLAAST